MRIKSKVAAETVTAKTPCKRGRKPKADKVAKVTEKNVTFSVRTDPGKVVYLAGCFNQWNPTGKKMLDKKDEGVYTASVKLTPGRYQYKFVIDGTWCADPENIDFVQNEHGTLNSVIVVD